MTQNATESASGVVHRDGLHKVETAFRIAFFVQKPFFIRWVIYEIFLCVLRIFHVLFSTYAQTSEKCDVCNLLYEIFRDRKY